MLASQIPANKFPLAFGQNAGGAYIRSIPVTSQIGIQNGAASLNDGFPPLTFIPTGAGGVPPYGQDMNGILNEISLWSQWLQAGGVFIPYDPAFSSAIGGYPKGAILASASAGSIWVSTADNNTTDPDTGGSGWTGIILPNLYAADAGTANALSVTLPATGPGIGGFTGWPIKVKKGAAANTGAATLTVNLTSGTATAAIVHPDGSALAAGELPANGMLTVVFDGALFQLQSYGVAPPQLATTAQMEAAASTSTFVSPGRTIFAPGAVKAYAFYSPHSQTLGAAYNVSSVTYNAVGSYTFHLSGGLNFTAGFPIINAFDAVDGPMIAAAHGVITGVNPTSNVAVYGNAYSGGAPAGPFDPDTLVFVVFGEVSN